MGVPAAITKVDARTSRFALPISIRWTAISVAPFPTCSSFAAAG